MGKKELQRMFFRWSWYNITFYPLTLKMHLYGNPSHLIAILFPDWPNTNNSVAFYIENWNCMVCVISLNEIKKNIGKKNKVLALANFFHRKYLFQILVWKRIQTNSPKISSKCMFTTATEFNSELMWSNLTGYFSK